MGKGYTKMYPFWNIYCMSYRILPNEEYTLRKCVLADR
jgi:hypothetical protein